MRLQVFAITLLAAGSLSADAPPPFPAAYQDLYNSLSAQIAGFNTAVNAGWNGSSYPFLNAPQLQAASSDEYTLLLKPGYGLAVSAQLDELQALGAKAVTLQILFPIFSQPFYDYIGNPAQYQQFVDYYRQLAAQIRARGMKLVVESSLFVPLVGTDVSQFQSYLSTLSWTDYMNARAANCVAVAQLIQPDYMSVLTESDTEESVSGQTNLNTPAGVSQLVQTILTALQDAGINNMQIGAGVGTWTKNYMQYVQALSALPMNFVDMHIYPINFTLFTNALTAADTIEAAGKQVGISECWETKVRDSELGVLDDTTTFSRDTFSFWEPIDMSFLQAIVNFAKYKQLAFISPYWVHYFFAYLDYNAYGLLPPSTVLTDSYTAATNANLVGAFTPTGLAWESMNNPPDTTRPATPAAPATSAIGTTTVDLEWMLDFDNVGVSAYYLYRDGNYLSTTSQLVYNDSGLVPGQTYFYTLRATDASGNVSGASAPLPVETIVCINNLGGRGNASGPGGAQVNLSWSAQTNATSYDVLRSSTTGGPCALLGTTGLTAYRDGDDGLVAGGAALIGRGGGKSALITMSPGFYAQLFYEYGFDFIGASQFPRNADEEVKRENILSPKDKATIVPKWCERLGFELNECVAFGDSMSDYLLFKELAHTVSINGDSTLRGLARYQYEGPDLREAFLTVCNALMTSPASRNSLATETGCGKS